MTVDTAQEILFGAFCLDRLGARLLRDGRPVPLTPKAFEVLTHLASHPNRLITKEELLSTVWPDVIVSDASIKVCIAELRKALDDHPKTPRYIETAHRRGYRFIAETAGEAVPATPRPDAPRADAIAAVPPPAIADARRLGSIPRPSTPFVGRASELSRLEEALTRAASSNRQVLFLCGAAGTGKTALIHAFLHRIGQMSLPAGGDRVTDVRGFQTPPLSCVGHCFERFGTSEPYLPIWEALTGIPPERRAPTLHRLLQTHTGEAGAPAFDSASPTPTEPRAHSDLLIREFTEALESQASQSPLLLILEDLHWADYSTLDLISALARRRSPMRLLIIGTYRPHDAAAAEPLRTMTYDLLSRRLCSEMRLGFLDERAVADYLRARLPSGSPGEKLCHTLYQRTLGHPLFLVSLIDDLLEQGLLDPTRDTAVTHITEAAVPRTARAMIESQFERLTPDEQRILHAAAVAGVEFGSAAAAGALPGTDVVACEEICDALARRSRFLEPAGVLEWPDGTVSNRYRFSHELYHNVVYGRIPAARCAQMHRSLSLRLEQAWRNRPQEVAAELAMHCERGREWCRAVTCLRAAAEHATRQYAHREAVDYLRRALSGLERLPEADRPADELSLLMPLAVHLQVTKGFAAPEVREVHDRAYAICQKLNDPRRVYPVLWGIWLFKKVRSDLTEARQLATRLLAMAHELDDTAFILQAQQSMAVTSLCRGDFRETCRAMREAQALYDPSRFGTNTQHFGQDPCVACLAFGSIAHHLMGDTNASTRASDQSLELAGQLAQPSTMALALHFSAMLHQLRDDAPGAERQARCAVELSAYEEFSFWHAGGRILCAWARAAQDIDPDDSIAELRSGIDAWLATGSRTYHTYFLGLLADVLLRHGRTAEALEVLEGAVELVGQLQEGLHHAELHRLTAHCLARSRGPDARASALEQLDLAAGIAQRQGALCVCRRIDQDRHSLGRRAPKRQRP